MKDRYVGPGQVVVHYRSHDYGVSIQFSDGQFANPAALKDVARAVIKLLKPAGKPLSYDATVVAPALS